jgi:hypothetical protein
MQMSFLTRYDLTRHRFRVATDITCVSGNSSYLLNELKAGRPVAVGWLHKGHISRPTGGGHWSVAVGTWARGLVMHDPYGEALLVTGGYTRNTNGAYLEYSWANWLPRWEVEGPRTGWYLTCSG